MWKKNPNKLISQIQSQTSMQLAVASFSSIFFSLQLRQQWITKNHQVFRQTRASLEGLHLQVDLAMKQHQVFSTQATMVEATLPTNDDIPPGFFLIDIGRLSSAQPQLIFRIDGSWHASSHMEHALRLLPTALVQAHSYQVNTCKVGRYLLV